MKALEFPVLSYDTETTSEKPATCRVCQVAAIRFEREPLNDSVARVTPILAEICDPGLASSDAATAIHGIGPEHWTGKRKDYEALAELHNYISSNYLKDGLPQFVVAGHHVRHFDMPILYRVSELPEIFGLPIVDTLVCAQRVYRPLPRIG